MTYITKPKTIKKSDIENKEFSFSISSFRYIKFINKNYKFLWDNEILKENIKWFEPWSSEYIDFWNNYFIRISEMDDLNYTFSISKDTKRIRPIDKNKFINNWDICYQTASNVWNICFYDWPKAYYNSHIRKLEFYKDKYYIFWILKSKFWKEQVDVAWSIKWVDNFREEYLLNTKIPFPTQKNNKNPEKVEKYLSLIVQNIIDKEEQIKKKNKLIDELIEKELKKNQKWWELKYSFPKISEILKVWRLDTWLYEREFKTIYNRIQNYKFWTSKIDELWFKTKKWPNLAISVIWESIYSDKKINNKFKQLILSKNVTEEWGLKKLQYIWNKVDLPTLNQFDFMLFARWDIGRVLLVDDFLVWATSNFDVFFISSELESYKNIFLLNYFKYLKWINFWEYFWVWGSWAPSLTDYFLKKLDIPNFSEPKQKEITELYYNKIEKNKDLNLENYLQKEKERNKKLGIFQLNMEIFDLREKLENLVEKIVYEKEIKIEL